MADAENALPPSKKRAAGREISRDNPGLDDDDDTPEQTGTFKKASEEVLATRRMVKVKRSNPTPSSNSVNPFANITLVPPPSVEVAPPLKAPEEQPVEEKVEDNGVEKATPAITTETNEKEEKEEEPKVEKTPETDEKTRTTEEEAKKDNGHGETESSPSSATKLNSFQQLSSNQNAFTGISGTGFSSSTFSFGSAAGSGFGSGSGSGSGSFPSFNFNNSNNGTSSKTETNTTTPALPSMQEVPVETGEENEKAAFTADAILFEYLDGGWKERGKGELKVNVSTTTGVGVGGKARLVMRARGNYRLILNAGLFPDMKLASMEKRGITFACMNEGKDVLTTFALKFKDGSVVEEFREVVEVHKGEKLAPARALKTPENSPKASDE